MRNWISPLSKSSRKTSKKSSTVETDEVGVTLAEDVPFIFFSEKKKKKHF